MIHPYSNACNELLLDQYLGGELDAAEKIRLEAHLERCRQCRRQLDALAAFTKDFRNRVQHATAAVDFMDLEKKVLNKARRQHHSRSGFTTFIASLKFTLPAAVTAGLLLFFAYSNYWVQPVPVPSAIINSFTGSMSSVMILETPETRQTILWYNEETTVESEKNAV